MRAAAKFVAHGSRCRSCVAWRLPPPPHRPVRLAHAGASRELLGVHPSSLIGENASIAPGARIGPFCVVSDDAVIGPNCELGAGVHILGATTLGADCVVRSHAVVGSPEPGTTVLGHGNVVGAHAVVGATCTDKKHAPALASHLVIGDGNDIREHAQIHRSSGPDTVTKIGSGCLLMGGVHVGHDCAVGDGVVASNNALLAGHVVVGDHAVLGGAVAISQRNGVGAHAFVAGGARVDGWVPACARAAGDRAEIRGVNVVGLRRAGYAREEILETMWVASALWRPAEETAEGSAEGQSAFGTAIGGVHARVRPPDARELARRVEAALAEAERRAKKPTKATEKKKVSAPPRASPAERMLRDARATLTEPGRTLLPWRAIPRGEASSRARAGTRGACDGVGGRRWTARRRIAAGRGGRRLDFARAASAAAGAHVARVAPRAGEAEAPEHGLAKGAPAGARPAHGRHEVPAGGAAGPEPGRAAQRRQQRRGGGGGSRGRGVARPRPQPRARLPVWGPV